MDWINRTYISYSSSFLTNSSSRRFIGLCLCLISIASKIKRIEWLVNSIDILSPKSSYHQAKTSQHSLTKKFIYSTSFSVNCLSILMYFRSSPYFATFIIFQSLSDTCGSSSEIWLQSFTTPWSSLLTTFVLVGFSTKHSRYHPLMWQDPAIHH